MAGEKCGKGLSLKAPRMSSFLPKDELRARAVLVTWSGGWIAVRYPRLGGQ